MSDKRKICQTSPEHSEAKGASNRLKLFKHQTSKMPISDTDLKKIKGILDESLDSKLSKATANLATKEDFNKLTAEINLLKSQNDELSRKVELFEARCSALEEELEWQSRELKAKNLIFTIPKEQANADIQTKIKCITQLLLGDEHSQILSPAIKLSENDTILKLKLNTGSNELAIKMLKNSSRLKNTGVYVQRDLTKMMQSKRRILLSYRKKIKTIKPSEKVQIKNNTLIIQDKAFYLSKNNELKYNYTDGEMILQEMFGKINFEDVNTLKLSNDRSYGNSKLSGAAVPKRVFTRVGVGSSQGAVRNVVD